MTDKDTLLTLEDEYKKITITVPQDSNIFDYVDAFKALLTAVGFHHDTIADIFTEGP
jgi:hypothetical protein